jgi:hypothetical protein
LRRIQGKHRRQDRRRYQGYRKNERRACGGSAKAWPGFFTRPVEDRPTLFYEGNFRALFEAIEWEQQRRDRRQECAESRIPASEALWGDWRAVHLSEGNRRQALRILPPHKYGELDCSNVSITEVLCFAVRVPCAYWCRLSLITAKVAAGPFCASSFSRDERLRARPTEESPLQTSARKQVSP